MITPLLLALAAPLCCNPLSHPLHVCTAVGRQPEACTAGNAQVGVQVLLLWMLYFFTGMALRESVLKVNGSAIRPWCAIIVPPDLLRLLQAKHHLCE